LVTGRKNSLKLDVVKNKFVNSSLKFILVVLLGTGASHSAWSSGVALAVKGGVAFSKTNSATAQYGMGYLGGIGAVMGGSLLGFNVDVLFSHRVYKFETVVNTQTHQSIYVPAVFAYKISPLLSLDFGGYGAYAIRDAENEGAGASTYDDMNANALDFGVVFGVTLKIPGSGFIVEARYKGGMADAYSEVVALKNSAFDILIGFQF
jgi:hypothetical protein